MGLSRDMLFDLVKPGECLGCQRRFSRSIRSEQGCQVIATAHDKAVEAGLQTIFGAYFTGTYIGAMIPNEDPLRSFQNSWVFPSAVPDVFLNECMGVRRGMWTVSWFCDELGTASRKAKSLFPTKTTLMKKLKISLAQMDF